MRRTISLLVVGVCGIALAGACGGGNKNSGFGTADGGSSGGGSSGGSSSSGSGSSSGSLVGDGSTAETGATGDPTTCAGAASLHSYIGCDYWPTVTANNVWSIFDYAVVVANAGTTTANITITGPGGTNQTATVAANGLTKIYLPWVAPLKGPDANNCGAATPLTASVLARGAAYHLVASVPVTVYQFNALEYVGQGGPTGKSWASCPGNTTCPGNGPVGCFSFSNDASLLLPSTAMTGNYIVIGHGGWGPANIGSTTTITSTTANTTVTIKVSSTGSILAGGNIAATAKGGSLTLTLNAGDVAELVGGATDADDNSGSVITANNPVQVITAMPCLDVPDNSQACDHVEETVLPAETLGQDYIVTQPTGPLANAVVQNVRIYGEFNGTTLTYAPSQPTNCPTSISAGQVVNCGQVQQDFEVNGSQPFGVAMFLDGASIVDPSTAAPNQQGDPSETMAVAVKQYRTNYVFLAPSDYTNNFVDVIAPTGTAVTLDGAPATATATAIGATGFGILRLKLNNTGTGAHTLTSSNPVGIQVAGYGSYTSYMYPGGLDLQHISPPPPAN
ncbi:MAG: IgGFc-binding protein [Polyangiaceae bacterium]